MEANKELIQYTSNDGTTVVTVNLADETVWLSLNDLVTLFDRDKSVISRHVRNVFKEGELKRDSTVAKFATVQQEGERTIERDIEYFNLDVIISVGYRVKSRRGTNFRIWATNVLKKHLIENARRSAASASEEDKYRQLYKAIQIAADTAGINEITVTEAQGILQILQQYAYALDILDKYDRNQLPSVDTTSIEVRALNYSTAKKLIAEWQTIEKNQLIIWP